MRNRLNRFLSFLGAMVGSAALLVVPGAFLTTLAPEAAAECMAPQTGEFDAHDLSGVWFRRGGDCGFGPEGSAPDLTPAGEEALLKNVPSRPRHPLHQERAVSDPALWNDPALTCNPKGMPQMVVDTAHDHHEVVQLENRILQLWQEERLPREIWLDGREVPSGENLLQLGYSWYGMSVGHWEGDTLVVETVGLDPRAWVDIYGYPKSEDARLIERYTRVDADTLEVQLTLTDPAYYTEPWVSDIKTYNLEPQDSLAINNFGWFGIYPSLVDLLCAPVNADGSPSNPRGGD